MKKYMCYIDGRNGHEVYTTSAKGLLYRYRGNHATVYAKSGKLISEAKRMEDGKIVSIKI